MSLPNVNPQSPLGSTINKIVKHVASNTLVKSKDFKITKDSNGMLMSLSAEHKNNSTSFQVYKGEYNPDAQYNTNDVVRVMPEKTYTSSIDQTTVNATAGVWVCVADLPDNVISKNLKSLGYLYPNYIRIDKVNYAPKWPEPTKTISQNTEYMSIEEKASVRYWELISLLPVAIHGCVNGVDQTYYTDSTRSDSL
jgi:hypothetical protein